ncbi:MAG: trypsin-like peptidase domain-containing protein [Candidatus Terrybacteria bacterium]|nr:trypsin-like peptidase domain-containing protein [Candidatus Terrybacteria bacterium]
MAKLIFRIVAIVLLGGIGGVVLERTAIPWLAAHEPFSAIPGFAGNGVTVVNPKEEVIIDRADALERAAAMARRAIVLVERRDREGNVLAAASGVAVTADGLVATDAAFTRGAGSFVVRRGGEVFPAALVTRNEESGVTLIRAETSGFPVLQFAESGDAPLGAMVFGLSAIVATTTDAGEEESVEPRFAAGFVVSEGALKDTPQIDLSFAPQERGAPIFTTEGKLVGLWIEDRVASAAAIRALVETPTL